LAERASFAVGDWGTGVGARFDLLLSNPPYVAEGAVLAPEVARHEPARALFAGADGLEAYRRLVPMLPGLLAPGGVAVLELGVGQAGDVLALAAGAGLSGAVCHDLGQRERALLLRARGGLGKAGAGF
jgi:release factor glutamine methyltransferase